MKRFLSLIFLFIVFQSMDCKAQSVAVSTNALSWLNLGTANAEVSVAVGKEVTLNAGAKYNPWIFRGDKRQVQNRQQSYHMGVRWWPWHAYSGWWISGKAQYQEYNDNLIYDSKAQEGDRYGLGVGTGYSIMLGEHFNLDFGLGLWSGYNVYTTYACSTCGKIVDQGKKWFFLPNDVILAITWIF